MPSSPRSLSPMRERPHPYVWAHGWRAWSVLSMSRFMSSSVIDPFLFHFPSPFAIVNSRALTSPALRSTKPGQLTLTLPRRAGGAG